MRVGHLEHEGADLQAAFFHRNMMFLTFGLTLVAFAWRWKRKGELSGAALRGYLALMALAAAFMSFGGHLGGELVYGEDFLPW